MLEGGFRQTVAALMRSVMGNATAIEGKNDDSIVADLLERHVSFRPPKLVSYLPIATIEGILKLSASEYQAISNGAGKQSAIYEASDCCIKSGAVYVFDESALAELLAAEAEKLTALGWPAQAMPFIAAIAKDWVEADHPLHAFIAGVFG